MENDIGNLLSRLVLPVGRRKRVVSLAHDFTGHVGVRRTKQLLNSRFTLPWMGKDVLEFVQSCDACLGLNKTGNRQVHMVERPIVTEPFESVAMDIVGPLPKGKGGVKFILTFICLATRWPEAVPMKSGSSSEVADGLVSILAFHLRYCLIVVVCFWVRSLNDSMRSWEWILSSHPLIGRRAMG